MQSERPNDDILSYIDEFFDYDPDTGKLYRLSKKYQQYIECTNTHDTGRYRVGIRYKQYYVANICWYLHYKTWPEVEIDHKDNDGYNNKIENLRLSGYSQNSANIAKKVTNKYSGVSYHDEGKKWRYRFSVNKKRYEVYGFNTELEAAKAREAHLDQLGDTFCARNKNLE